MWRTIAGTPTLLTVSAIENGVAELATAEPQEKIVFTHNDCSIGYTRQI